MLDAKLQSEEYKFYFLFFLSMMFVFSMLMPMTYGDLGIWIAEGRQIIQQGTLHIIDVYSFNPTESHPYPWLSSLFYYLLDKNFSVESIFILHRLIPVAIVGFWLTCYPKLMEKTSILVLTLSIVGASMLIVDRPALLVLPLIPYFYELIESDKIYQNKLKSLFILVLWTNAHGSFLLFLLLLAYKLFIQIVKVRKLAAIKDNFLLLCYAFIATLINPWGLKIYDYVLTTASISKIRISEWQPLWLSSYHELAFEIILLSLGLLYLFVSTVRKKKLSALFSSTIPVFAIFAVLAVRNLPLLFSVLPLFWGKYIAENVDVSGYTEKANILKISIHRIIVGAFIAIGIFMFTSYSDCIRPMLSAQYANRYDNSSSFRITEYLNNSSGKKIFNDWFLGSFLVFSQSNQIFIDTRNIIYNEKTYSDYLKITENYNNQAEALLNEYHIDFVVSDKTNPLTKTLQTSANWNFIMDDNGYSLFEKK